MWMRIFSVSTLAGLCAVTTAVAVPTVGQVPQKGHVRAGIFLRSTTLDVYEYDNQDVIEESDIDYNAMQLQYGVSDAFAVSLRYGMVSWRPNPRSSENFEDGTAWGLGISGAIPVYRPRTDGVAFDVGWDFQYDDVSFDSIVRWDGAPFGAEADWWRAEIGVHGAYQIYRGFVGLRYSEFDLRYTHPGERGLRRGGFQEDSPWGGVIGAGVFWPNGILLQTELMVGDVSGYEFAILYDVSLPEGWLR
jgi:hypothetical protein